MLDFPFCLHHSHSLLFISTVLREITSERDADKKIIIIIIIKLYLSHTQLYNQQWNVFSAFNPSKCTHTWSSGQLALRRPGSSWGFGALLKGLTSVMDTSSRSRDSNPQPRVTSPMHYPLEPRQSFVQMNCGDRIVFGQELLSVGNKVTVDQLKHTSCVIKCYSVLLVKPCVHPPSVVMTYKPHRVILRPVY